MFCETTLQCFGFKPASNSTMLTVSPQSTEATTPTKTPEQIQQQASDEGWLQVWPEFSWSYPWFRIHVKIDINPTIEVAFNPVLPGGEWWNWTGLEVFAAITSEVLQEFIIDVVGIFTAYLAAKALSIWNPAVGIIAELTKGAIQFGLLVAFNWNSRMELLVGAIVNIIMGFIALEANIGKMFIQALCRLTGASVSSALLDLHFKLLHVLFVAQFTGRWWLDVLEATIDWVIGGIALVRYFTMS